MINALPKEFQFQSGAIKRHDGYLIYSYIFKFQFQSGAIKSRLFLAYVPNNLDFNSRVVRLKEGALVVTPFVIVISIPEWCD